MRTCATLPAPGLLLFLLASFAVWPASVQAADTIPGPIQAEVLRVIDGDTIEVRAKIWLDQYIETGVRLAGLDAPELRGKCEREKALARKAKARVEQLVKPGSRVRLTKIREGKYAGRVVAVVSFQYLYGQEALATMLIEEGLARRYKGSRREGWCDGG